jgi:hypothetical protein
MEKLIEETLYYGQAKLKAKLGLKAITDLKYKKDSSEVYVCSKESGMLNMLFPKDRQETIIYKEQEFIEKLELPQGATIINISYNKKQLPMFDSIAVKIKYKEAV